MKNQGYSRTFDNLILMVASHQNKDYKKALAYLQEAVESKDLETALAMMNKHNAKAAKKIEAALRRKKKVKAEMDDDFDTDVSDDDDVDDGELVDLMEDLDTDDDGDEDEDDVLEEMEDDDSDDDDTFDLGDEDEVSSSVKARLSRVKKNLQSL